MKYYLYPLTIIEGLLLLSCSGNNLPPGGSGLIEATDVIVSAETGGQLKGLYFDEGDKIAVGDTLALIDTVAVQLKIREMEATGQSAETRKQSAALAIEQADFNLKLAEKEFRRVSELLKSGSVNQQSYDQAENAYNQASLAKKQAAASYQAAQADLARIGADTDLLKKQLGDCFPTAPITGTIINKYIEAGELVSPGKALVKIAKLDTVWVKIYLPPSDLAKIRLGGTARVDPEDGGATIPTGRVTWISEAAEFTPKNVQTKEARADLLYAVKITVANDDKRLKIGMPVSVVIE